jgi:hypothetical protein
VMNQRLVIGGHGGRSGHAFERSMVSLAARPVSLDPGPAPRAAERTMLVQQ